MRILITNDDGIASRGLETLERVAAGFGEVWTVAPDRDKSGISHAISLHSPLRVHGVGERRYTVENGSPCDCVYMALHHVMRDAPPDLVLSGINPGPNLGWDVLYSGTAAGAREGVLQGIPGLALSLISGGRGYPFEDIVPWVERLIRRTIEQPPPRHTFLNANIPNPRVGPIKGIRATVLGERYYSKEVVVREDPRGREYVWIGGHDVEMPDIEHSDCNAIRMGCVSVTPLMCRSTDDAFRAEMTRWNEETP